MRFRVALLALLCLVGCSQGLKPVPAAPLDVTVTPDAVLGGIGSASGQLLRPSGVAVDPRNGSDLVYVADTGNQRIQYLNQAGDFMKSLGRFGVGPGDFNGPFALALDYGQ